MVQIEDLNMRTLWKIYQLVPCLLPQTNFVHLILRNRGMESCQFGRGLLKVARVEDSNLPTLWKVYQLPNFPDNSQFSFPINLSICGFQTVLGLWPAWSRTSERLPDLRPDLQPGFSMAQIAIICQLHRPETGQN